MSSITLPLTEAIQAFSATLPHSSKDDQAQAVTEIQVTSEGEAPAYLLATDRYSMARYELSEATPETFRIPRAATEWISKIAVSALRHGKLKLEGYTLRIEHDDADTTATILHEGKAERAQSFDLACTASFPPVQRLLSDAKLATDAQPFNLTPQNLEKLTAYARKFEPGESVTFEQTSTTSGKPGPISFSIGKLSGLIQPDNRTR